MIELQKKIVLPWAMVDYYKYIDNKQLYACLVGCCLMLDECVTIIKDYPYPFCHLSYIDGL